MRQRLRLFLFFAIFWIGFQVIARCVFLAYNHDLAEQLTFAEIVRTFAHGFKMDLSISSYFLTLTGLFLTGSVFIQAKWTRTTLNLLNMLILFLCSAIIVVDIELYRNWGFRMDTTPLFYFAGAKSEAVGSVDFATIMKLLLILASLVVLSLVTYSRWLMPKVNALAPATSKTSAIVLLAVTAFLFLPMRGSLTVAPMNVGFVYFHPTKAFANHAAVNVVWNFFYKVQQSDVVYPTDFFDNALAKQYVDSLYRQRDSTAHIFNLKKPNIVLFILESFTSEVIEPLGGVKGLTPNLNQLCSEGILFTNFYSSAERTDKGLVSVLSGYPAQPRSSIIKFTSKAQKLPNVIKSFAALGYHTSFVYGGDIDYANLRFYLTNAKVNHITSEDDFEGEELSKWGVHDHIVFRRALNELDTAKAPFFKTILSLSSHEPFDVPMTPYIKERDLQSLFFNSVHYTDQAIGDFVEKAKRSDWWPRTVIIFVADHGSRHPNKKELKDRNRYKIPLLMIGGAIRKDTTISLYGNQTDLANTLLAQVDRARPEFRFSKNMLAADAKSFSFYFFNDGYGYVAPGKHIVYDNAGARFLNDQGTTEEDRKLTKAYQQMLYLDYNSK